MPIAIQCHNCSAKMTAPEAAAGKKVKCPKCQCLLTIPQAELYEDVEVLEAESDPIPEKRRPKKARVRVADDSEDEDAPSRRTKSPKRAPQGVSRLQVVACAFGLILLLALGLGAYYFLGGGTKPNIEQVDNSPSAQAARHLASISARQLEATKSVIGSLNTMNTSGVPATEEAVERQTLVVKALVTELAHVARTTDAEFSKAINAEGVTYQQITQAESDLRDTIAKLCASQVAGTQALCLKAEAFKIESIQVARLREQKVANLQLPKLLKTQEERNATSIVVILDKLDADFAQLSRACDFVTQESDMPGLILAFTQATARINTYNSEMAKIGTCRLVDITVAFHDKTVTIADYQKSEAEFGRAVHQLGLRAGSGMWETEKMMAIITEFSTARQNLHSTFQSKILDAPKPK